MNPRTSWRSPLTFVARRRTSSPVAMLRQFHLPLFVVVVAVTMIEAMDPPEATEPTTTPDEFLIVTETSSLRLVTPNGSLVRTIENTQTQRVVGVAHDVDTQTIFWTDTNLDVIVTSNVDGTNVRTIVSRLVMPSGVAYDPSAKHVYFSDSSLDIIGVATLDGHYSIPLISTDLVEPRAIILQPSMGLMYWIDLGSKAKIERAFMSGNNRTALIEGYDLGWPNGLTISGERLYWMDGKADKMESSDLDGNDRQVMLTFSANIHPFGMVITSEMIYFTDSYARVVYGLPMSSNLSESDLSVVTRTKATPYGLSLYRAGESATEVNRCSQNNGDCEQMCLAEPTGRICACSVGVLNPDGVSCGEPDTIIFLVENDDIHGYVLRNGALQPAIAPITTVKKPLSVTVDPTTELLYVTDITDRAIFEVTKDGQKRLVRDDPPLSYADNIAVDHISKVLYYTDRTANIIGVVSVKGDWWKTLIGGLDEPRGLKLDIAEGMIYWSDWGSVPKIERVSMTGERRQVLVSTLIVWPNGITLDLTERLLYWADARLDRIEVCNFDGTNRRLIGTFSRVHPYALDIYGDLLIWSDWQHNKVGSVNIDGGNFKVFVAPLVSFRQPTGLKVYNSSAPVATSACLNNDCSSDQVCVPENSTSHQCICKFGNYNPSTGKCDRPSQFLLLVENREIQGVNLSSTATDPVEAMSRITNVSAHDIDYDAKTERIYWTRPETGEIWSSPLNDTTGKSRSVINTDITLVRPTAIAVDWMSRLLYYTEWKGTSSAISVISFDGTMQMTLIDSNLTEPASIEVDPETGYMFWTDTGVYPRVELAYMNGENRRSVYPEGFVQLPTAVTFNRRDRMIFYCDAKADIILGIPLDVTTSLVSSKRLRVQSVDVHPFSLATVGDDVYFADHNLRGVWRWTTTSNSANRIYRTNNVPFALRLYDDKRVTTPATANACANDNGGCARMCLAVPGGRRCGCSAWDTSACLPIIVNGSSGVTATIGDSLPCRYESVLTTGIEVTHVEWWLNGNMTKLIDDDRLNDTSYVATESGTYRCIAYNSYGSATSSSIFVPPPTTSPSKTPEPVKNDADYKPTCDCVSTTLVCVIAVDVQLGGGSGANGDAYLVKPKAGVYATCLSRKSWENVSVSAIGFVENSWNDGACSVSSKSFAVRQGFTESDLAERPCSLVSSSPTSPLDVKVVEHLYASSNGRLRLRAVDLSTLNKDTEDLRSSSCDCESEVLFRWLQGKAQTKTSNCTTKESELLASVVIENDQCGLLRAPPRSRLSCSSSGQQETCSIQCDKGYVINGSISTAKQTCNPAVGWSPEELRCRLADCGPAPIPPNGVVACTGTTVNSTCTQSCNVGHVLIGDSGRRCQADGKWNGSVAKCARGVPCSSLKSPQNGSVSCTGIK